MRTDWPPGPSSPLREVWAPWAEGNAGVHPWEAPVLWPGGERGYTGAERGGRAGGRPELGGPRWSKGGLWDRPKDAPPASGPRPCTWPGASSWLRLPAKPWLYLVPHTAPQGIGLYCPLSRRRPSPRGPACPGAGVLLVDGSRVQAPPGAQPKPGSVLHGAVRLAWAGVEKTMGLLSCCFPPTKEPPRLLPRPPWLAARRARLGAAAARVPGHRRTCSLASLCPCYRRLIYWRIFPHWPGITQPHWLGGHPSRWAVPRSSHGGTHSGVGVAREQESCSQGQCPMAGEFGHPGRAFWSIWGHPTS